MSLPIPRRPVALVIAAIVAVATTACAPSPTPPTTVGQHQGATDRATSRCDPGDVCGTCSDGSSWAYLDDPRYTHDPLVSTLVFDEQHPCG